MKRARLSQGLSQEKLAALAGLHPNYIGSVERAERNISIDNIEKIAKALALSPAVLLSVVKFKGER
jgi:transcriptional regulator with XRE-family HTH domain